MAQTASVIEETPKVTLIIDPQDEKSASPVMPIAWKLSDELIEEMHRRDYKNPHIVFIIAQKRDLGYNDEQEYKALKIEKPIPLNKFPKHILQFTKSGENFIVAMIIEFTDGVSETFTRYIQKAMYEVRMRVPKPNKEDDFVDWNNHDSFFDDIYDEYILGQVIQPLDVDADMFSKEPSAFNKRFVQVVTRNRPVDNCDNRKHVLQSIPLHFFVQLYGLGARPLFFLWALFMAKQGIQPRLVVSMYPHDFLQALGNSLWYYNKNGTYRKGWLRWVNPPQIMIYLGIVVGAFFAIMLIPFLVVGVTSEGYNFPSFLKYILVIDLPILVILGIILLASTHRGRNMWRDFTYLIGKIGDKLFDKLFGKIFTNRIERRRLEQEAKEIAAKEAAAQAESELYARMREFSALTRDTVDPNQLENATARLKFLDLKGKVCKPFEAVG